MKILIKEKRKRKEISTTIDFINYLFWKNKNFSCESEQENKNQYINSLIFSLLIYLAYNCLTEKEKYVFIKLWLIDRGCRKDWNYGDTYQNKFNLYKASIKNLIKILKFTGYYELVERVLSEKQ